MRFNPRLVNHDGPFNKRTDRHEWRTGGVVGLTVEQIQGILRLARDYRENDKKSSQSPDYASYDAEQTAAIARIQSWIDAGPQPYNHREHGLYRSRGAETVLLMDGYHEISNIITQVSLRLYSLMEQNKTPATEKLYGREQNERATLSPEDFAIWQTIKRMEKMFEAKRSAEYDISSKSISKLTGREITKRLDEVKRERRFRVNMAEMFKEMAAKRNGVIYEKAEAVDPAPVASTPYVKPEQRPTGKTYDLPTPDVKIGDKLRPGFARSADFRYYRAEFIKRMIKGYRPTAKKRSKTVQNLRLHPGHKAAIRSAVSVLDNCYEIEVAGLMPSCMHLNGVANQCYVGGGSGWSGISYHAVLLFRGEAPKTGGEGMNQMCVMIEKGPHTSTLTRYVMPVEEVVAELAEAA